MAQLLLVLGASRGLRDHAGMAPADIARQRNHWDLLTLLEGAEPLDARHKATPGREAGALPRVRTASGSLPPRGGGAAPRSRTLSAGAGPRGGGACPPPRRASVDWAVRGGGAHARGRSQSGGAAGGPPPRGRGLSAGMRGPRPAPEAVRGRCGVAAGCRATASPQDWPCDWVALGAGGPASCTPTPPLCLTPSPEQGSPQVVCSVPLDAGGENPK